MGTFWGAETLPGVGGTHYGFGSLGTPGALVPTDGDNGGSYLANDVTLPADDAVEVYGPIEDWPVGLTLFAPNEDGSFLAAGPDGVYTFTYRLWADLEDRGTAPTPSMITIGNPSAGTLSGGVTLADVVGSGGLVSAPSVLSGAIQLADVLGAGSLSPPFILTFNPRFYRAIRQRRFETRTDRKAPSERVTVTYDFSYDMFGGKAIVGQPSTSIRVKRGADDPGLGEMVFISPSIAGSLVMLGFQNGIHRRDYALTCEVDLSDGQHVAQTYVIPVRNG